MAHKRVTLKDVAQAAGVATGTVSMVLNESPLVADATKERVQTAMQALGYVYDQAAGNLRGKRSKIVGVSICNLINPYFADVTAGIQQALENLGRVLVLGNCAESVPRQMHFLQTLRQYRVEGVLLTPAISTPAAHVEQLLDWHVPLVQVTRYVEGTNSDYVGNDNRLGAMLATRHLIELGHERLAYLGRNQQTSTGRDRFEGFTQAITDAGLPVRPDWVIECPATREDGFRHAMALMQQPEAPSAMFCFNDTVAFGAMLGLRSLGLEPGQDCSVVGMDDVSESALWQPGLTTVSIGRDTIGRAAGQLLTERVENPEAPVRRVILKPTLVVRASSGPVDRRVPRSPRYFTGPTTLVSASGPDR